jgi:outer membrane protein W
MLLRSILILVISFSFTAFSQYNRESYSLLLGMDYITSAQIYLNPNSSDIILRNQSYEVTNLFAPLIDFRYRINDDIVIGISSEYILKEQRARNLVVREGSQEVHLDVDDGVQFIPIELSVYYSLPFSTDQFKFTMGGGTGYYFGKQIRKFGDADIMNIKNKTSLGLLVSVGMEYLFIDKVGLRLDMKFRSPEISLTNQYSNDIVNYEGTIVKLFPNTFDSKINLDGISFVLGISYQF